MSVLEMFVPVEVSGSNPDSGPNSPPGSCNRQASPSAGGRNTPIQEVSYFHRVIEDIMYIS